MDGVPKGCKIRGWGSEKGLKVKDREEKER